MQHLFGDQPTIFQQVNAPCFKNSIMIIMIFAMHQFIADILPIVLLLLLCFLISYDFHVFFAIALWLFHDQFASLPLRILFEMNSNTLSSAKVVKEWTEANNIKILSWPSNSPV